MQKGVLRTINKIKDTPRLSIITVVRNGKNFLDQTILSIVNQNYENFEYIIIDGESTDGTIDIIRKHEDKIDFWLSEADTGIYDAMNKGVKYAKGDYVIFMNSGDLFYRNSTVANVFNKSWDAGIIYGGEEIDYRNGLKKKVYPESIDKLKYGMHISHQSIFAKRELLKLYPFDLQYKISADYDFLLKCYKSGVSFVMINEIIATVLSGGLSDNNYKSVVEHFSINKKYYNKIGLLLFFKKEIFLVRFKNLIKKFLPKKAVKFIIKLKC